MSEQFFFRTEDSRESSEAMQTLVEQLRQIPYAEVRGRLDAKLLEARALDPKAGIVIVPLQDVESLQVEGQEYDFYAARVMPVNPENPNYVNPHYHLHGEEPYVFSAGTRGEMNTGKVEEGGVRWNPSFVVEAGQEIVIREGEVHSFRNQGEGPYDFLFACPKSHLQDYDAEKAPLGDRYFTKNLQNGIPPSYYG